RNTTKLWIQRWEDEGNVQHHKSNGRPKKTTLAQDDEIIETYQRNPFKRTQEVANAHQVSTTTIRRRLKSAGLKNRVPARKPLLTDRHKQLRLTFAHAYLNFDFTNVVFLDEKVFSSSSDGRVSLWRINNTRYNQANILEDRRSGRITCGVWGWMSSSGPGELCEITGRLNSVEYTGILSDILLPTVRISYPNISPIYVVQDNSPIHNSRLTLEWFNTNDTLKLINFPPKSPDLNPIENLWGLMVQQWDATQSRTRDSLCCHAFEIWESFRGSQICFNMVASMQERLQDVIDANGGYTRF
ncbi:hypothetical protein HF086_017393, partial [Spodoptera exigua]